METGTKSIRQRDILSRAIQTCYQTLEKSKKIEDERLVGKIQDLALQLTSNPRLHSFGEQSAIELLGKLGIFMVTNGLTVEMMKKILKQKPLAAGPVPYNRRV